MLSEDVEHNFGRDIEQITKTPVQESVKKEKDPKKVAAGKKLAEYNKRAKEALKEKMKREAEKVPEEERKKGEPCSRRGWIPEMSFTTVISVVCISLTAIDLFMRFNKKDNNKPDPPPRLPEPPSELLRPQPSKIPVPTPKIGMI